MSQENYSYVCYKNRLDVVTLPKLCERLHHYLTYIILSPLYSLRLRLLLPLCLTLMSSFVQVVDGAATLSLSLINCVVEKKEEEEEK